MLQAPEAPVATTSVAVTVVGVVETGAGEVATVTPVQTETVTVGPVWKPTPVIVTGTLTVPEPGTGEADGLRFVMPIPVIVKAAGSVTVPPSGLVTVTLYVPGVAELPVSEFDELMCTLSEVALVKVEEPWLFGEADDTTPAVNTALLEPLARVVPLTVLVKVTFAPVTKPVPVMTSVVTGIVGVESTAPVTLSDETVGAGFTVTAPANVATPLSSVTVRLYEPGTVADVEAKFAVAVVVADSAPLVKVRPGAVEVTVTFPPSLANPVPVIVTTPEAPVPNWPAPPGAKDAEVIVPPAAPATPAMAIGSAAAASKAPAASAFTKWRCIRRGLFMVNSLHS
jgi:hypothetical protein